MEKEIEKAIRETLVIENPDSVKYAVIRIMRLIGLSHQAAISDPLPKGRIMNGVLKEHMCKHCSCIPCACAC